jgi:repressor LexA
MVKRHHSKTTGRGLTPRQRKVLDFVKEQVAEHGYPPSMREIGIAVGLTSPSSVKHQLEVLEIKGYLRRDRRLPRALEIVDLNADVPAALRSAEQAPPKPRWVPIVDRLTAGTPVVAEEATGDVYPLPRALVGDGELFILRVPDNSMAAVAIIKDDLVVVRRDPAAGDGQVVAAQLGEAVIIRTLDASGKRLLLRPQDPAFETVEAHAARILGPVVCLIRSY